MFCEKCGNKLSDVALFCTKCGNKVNEDVNQHFDNSNNTETITNELDKDTVIFEVKSSFKFAYVALPLVLVGTMALIPIVGLIKLIIKNITVQSTTALPAALKIFLLIILALPLFLIISIIVKSILDKNKYKNYTYTFYQDRVVFKDSFMNISEKELKYKYIREVLKHQTLMQRCFNIGNIELFSNAESGFGSGISMVNIENVNEIYRKIKDFIKM